MELALFREPEGPRQQSKGPKSGISYNYLLALLSHVTTTHLKHQRGGVGSAKEEEEEERKKSEPVLYTFFSFLCVYIRTYLFVRKKRNDTRYIYIYL